MCCIIEKRYFCKKNKNVMNEIDFYKGINVSITICDNEGTVIYQNEKSAATFGDKTGQSMLPCHQQRSQEIIHRLLNEGDTNAYTIEKKGVRKMIYQTPWYNDGVIGGLIEFSIVLPETRPHYVRE